MNKTYLIGNWKMSLVPNEAIKLAEDIAAGNKKASQAVEQVICPGFESLLAVAEKIKGTSIALGAQDCFWEDAGAYTGEVSAKVLKDVGCKYVIIGHSERRANVGETNEQVNKKVHAALRNGLIPIVCVGETFEERQEGQKDFVVMHQVNSALKDIKLFNNDRLIIAYEPVWVIGSGQAVEPAEAEFTAQVIKQVLWDNFSEDIVKEKTSIIYGGSVNESNVKGFLSQPTVSGFLLGKASLTAESYLGLIKAIAEES